MAFCNQSATFPSDRDACDPDINCSPRSATASSRRRSRCQSSVNSCSPLQDPCKNDNNISISSCTEVLRCCCIYLLYFLVVAFLSIMIYSILSQYSKTLVLIEDLKTQINSLRSEILANQKYDGKPAKPPEIGPKIISNDLIQLIDSAFSRETQNALNECNEIKALLRKIQSRESKSYDPQFELILTRLDEMQQELLSKMSVQSTSLTTTSKPVKKSVPQIKEIRVDYAAESLGGEIFSTDETRLLKMYHFGSIFGWIENTPRMIIQPSIFPGECFGFAGQTGSVVIKLMARVFIDAVTIGHIPKDLSPSGDLTAAPRNITVSGLTEPNDTQTTALANFEYDTNKTDMFQTFPVTTATRSFQFVRFNFTSNYGNLNHTCVYRVRVHGKLDEK